MENKEKTRVIFLWEVEVIQGGNGHIGHQQHNVVAVFPDDRTGLNNAQTPAERMFVNLGCYARIGQHSTGILRYFDKLEPVKPEEYADLKQELESIGYELEVVGKEVMV